MLNFTLEPILDPGFEVRLKESNFALWASLKEQYFLPGINFTYTFTPKLNRKHSFQIREFMETTGNSAFVYALITKKEIELFKTSISQYYKNEIEIRYTYKAAKKHILASRLFAGAAVPVYKTARVPYSRQFFLGGPSSMRGWAMRQLGPGRIRSVDGAQFQLGDIRLEMNLEYRFMFNTWIGSTLFADVGNIWYAKKYNSFTPQIPYSNIEDGVFNANFINELAMDIGTGVRLDFSFFVLRFDIAVPIRNPAGFSRKDQNGFVYYTDDKGFPIYWKFDWRNTNFVLAVGYPF
jgi:outer membrane translocation and assembly module TamA